MLVASSEAQRKATAFSAETQRTRRKPGSTARSGCATIRRGVAGNRSVEVLTAGRAGAQPACGRQASSAPTLDICKSRLRYAAVPVCGSDLEHWVVEDGGAFGFC